MMNVHISALLFGGLSALLANITVPLPRRGWFIAALSCSAQWTGRSSNATRIPHYRLWRYSRVKYLSFLILTLATINCGPSQSERDAAAQHLQETLDRQKHELDQNCAETILHSVELTQGESAAQELLYCQQHGYPVTFDTKNRSDAPVVVIGGNSATPPPISNRHKAQCDSIVKTENLITRLRTERKAAEEKRKDEAYDRVHKK